MYRKAHYWNHSEILHVNLKMLFVLSFGTIVYILHLNRVLAVKHTPVNMRNCQVLLPMHV